MTEVVNLEDKFGLFQEHWRPKIVSALNESYVKLVKLKGEFVWHRHENEDELFLVIKGRLLIRLRDCDLSIGEGGRGDPQRRGAPAGRRSRGPRVAH